MSERRKLLLKITLNESAGQYDFIDETIYIEKDLISEKLYVSKEGYDSTSRWGYKDQICDNFEKAFEYVYEDKFYYFNIDTIDKAYIFFYTKKLIEKLNEEECKMSNGIPFYTFRNELNIDLRLVTNANQKGLKIIKFNKLNSDSDNIYFVGKMDVSGNFITIKDENNEIIHLTSGNNISIDIDEIEEENFWYFKKN